MFTTRPELVGTFGMVSSTHWLASAAGMAMLEHGGNAFDAAVAAGLVLQVAEPHLNGPGGDLPILMAAASEERVRVVCGQGVAPQRASVAHYRSLGLDLIPGTGLLATVVPGAFDAWMLMLRDYGSLAPEVVFEPAIHYAETGIPTLPRIRDTIAQVQDLFRTEWTGSAAVYLPHGALPQVNQLLRNPQLAQTWTRMLTEAKAQAQDRADQVEALRKMFYQGFVAEAIDRFCRDEEVMDSSGKRNRAVLSGEDLARWSASYESPVSYSFGEWTACKCGPWSQGLVQLQILALLRDVDWAATPPESARFVHLITEATKLAMADREAYYGDPNFVEVPVEALLSEEYNTARRRLLGEEASLELRPGHLDGLSPRMPRFEVVDPQAPKRFDAMGVGEPTVQKNGESRGDTCHVDVVDRWGNMVSAMPSGGWLQSSPVIPELGFCLNSRAQMFWLDEGLPSTLAPGKRPRTTLTPSLTLREGRPYLAFGTPGGDQQDQWQTSFLLRHLRHGLNLQEAIDCPAFHNESFPESFFPRRMAPGKLVLESRFSPEAVEDLRRRGHVVKVEDPWSEGRLCAVSQESGLLKAGANARGMQGYAAGR
ncbi:MAG: gamma-glutamyltransferase family protein [bacterium]